MRKSGHLAQRPCLLCGGTDAKLYLSVPTGGQLFRCPRDGFVFRNPQLSREEQKGSYKSHMPNIYMFVDGRRLALAAYAHAIQARKLAGRLVDVGCSLGTFFEFFPSDRWIMLGIDPSEFNTREVHRRHGVPTFCGTLMDAALPKESVDVLTILDTFQLVPDPRAELRESLRVLKIGGILAIEIEGWLYWTLTIRGPLCWLLYRSSVKLNPTQLHFFSYPNLVTLLEREGFHVVGRLFGPASMSRSLLRGTAIRLHEKMSRLLFTISARQISFAARELVIAEKTGVI